MLGMATQTKKAHSVKEAAAQFGASVPFVRKKIREGELRAKKVGRKVIILDSDLQTYLENQPDWKPGKEKQTQE
jgi:excisionase family DNA binding protein